MAIAAMIAAVPAMAQQSARLQGVWQYSRVNTRNQNYSGNIVIDARGMASDVTKRPSGPDVAQSGRVVVNGSKIEIIFDKAVPSGPPDYSPDHFYCTLESDRAMNCSNTDVAGSTSYRFALVWVGNTSGR